MDERLISVQVLSAQICTQQKKQEVGTLVPF
jgi:hypothetical protein